MLCFLSSVYWTESSTANGSSLYRHDGQTTHLVLGQSAADDALTSSRSSQTGCSCTAMSLSEQFAVDTTSLDVNRSEALFVWHKQSGEIWTADRQGCQCRRLHGTILARPHIGTCTDGLQTYQRL